MSISMNLNVVPLIQSASIVCCTFMFVCMLPSAYARELFAWHPIFMTLGYIGFMCEGIIVSFKSRAIEGVTRAGVLTNHMWLQLTSAIMVGIGFAAIYVNKAIHGKDHFTSLHGKLGLITTIMTMLALVLGVISFRKLGIISVFPSESHAGIKWMHRLVGITTWSLALLVIQLDLPHAAVMTGFVCRLWQVAVLGIGALVLYLLGYTNPGKSAVLPQVVDFTLVPRQNKNH